MFRQIADDALTQPGVWVRVPADQCTPALPGQIRGGFVPEFPPDRFEARTERGVNLSTQPRFDVWVRALA